MNRKMYLLGIICLLSLTSCQQQKDIQKEAMKITCNGMAQNPALSNVTWQDQRWQASLERHQTQISCEPSAEPGWSGITSQAQGDRRHERNLESLKLLRPAAAINDPIDNNRRSDTSSTKETQGKPAPVNTPVTPEENAPAREQPQQDTDKILPEKTPVTKQETPVAAETPPQKQESVEHQNTATALPTPQVSRETAAHPANGASSDRPAIHETTKATDHPEEPLPPGSDDYIQEER